MININTLLHTKLSHHICHISTPPIANPTFTNACRVGDINFCLGWNVGGCLKIGVETLWVGRFTDQRHVNLCNHKGWNEFGSYNSLMLNGMGETIPLDFRFYLFILVSVHSTVLRTRDSHDIMSYVSLWPQLGSWLRPDTTRIPWLYMLLVHLLIPLQTGKCKIILGMCGSRVGCLSVQELYLEKPNSICLHLKHGKHLWI